MMAVGDTMQGRRLPGTVFGEPGLGWQEWEKVEPGTYLKAASDGGAYWHITLPSGIQFTLGPQHAITEHEDGTITVSPSIYDAPDGWHGYLERGVWREV